MRYINRLFTYFFLLTIALAICLGCCNISTEMCVCQITIHSYCFSGLCFYIVLLCANRLNDDDDDDVRGDSS